MELVRAIDSQGQWIPLDNECKRECPREMRPSIYLTGDDSSLRSTMPTTGDTTNMGKRKQRNRQYESGPSMLSIFYFLFYFRSFSSGYDWSRSAIALASDGVYPNISSALILYHCPIAAGSSPSGMARTLRG